LEKETQMNRTMVGLIAIAALVVAVELRAQPEAAKGSTSLVGTWELSSFKYGGMQPNFSTPPAGRRRLKLFTETHFTWVEFDTATKKIKSVAGGTWSLKGDTYTESNDWMDASMASYLASKNTFTIRMEGDKFHQSGSLANGMKIEEVWQRVKL
jgi:hypothetical protein